MKDTFVNAMRLNTDRFQIKDFFTEAASLSIAVKNKSHVTFVKKKPQHLKMVFFVEYLQKTH